MDGRQISIRVNSCFFKNSIKSKGSVFVKLYRYIWYHFVKYRYIGKYFTLIALKNKKMDPLVELTIVVDFGLHSGVFAVRPVQFFSKIAD